MQNREAHPGIHVVGRLRPGVSLAEMRAELSLISHHLAEQYPKANAARMIAAQPLSQEIVGDVRPMLWLLLGTVSLLLLIACVNVASLLLVRAVSRERELAVRVALGASRSRLVRQCLTESAVVGLAGGVLGILLAAVGIRPFVMFWPGSLPRAEEVRLDWRVLLFALAVSFLSGLLFGLAPALRVPARQLEQALRAGARTVAGGSRRWRGGFVIAELALAIVLMICAGMLGRTILRLSSVDSGVNVRNVLVSRLALSPAALLNGGQTRAAFRDILDRARGIPGVESVALSDVVPMSNESENELGYWTTTAAPPLNQVPLTLASSVTPDYLKVMGIRLLQGRFFNEHDRLSSEPVVVIDEVLARLAFSGRWVIGKRLSFQGIGPAYVVGMVSHVRHWGLADDDKAPVRDHVYYPFAQLPDYFLRFISSVMSVSIRTSVTPLAVIGPLRRELRGSANDQVLYDIRTMEQIASSTIARQRFLLLLFGTFACLSMLLACIGLYGVLAYLTSQRVPEIGVRIAMGATARDVIGLVVRESLGMTSLGVDVGLCVAWAAARIIERLVTGVRGGEPLTFVTMISVLVFASLLATFVPARRASRVNPMKALREE